MKNILITGGLGFIGSNLAKFYVKTGCKVSILTRSLDKIKNVDDIIDEIQIIEKDIVEVKEEVKGMDVIFHCASTNHNYHILDDPNIDINVNCNGTIALLEACKEFNKDVRIVFCSTFFVNGDPVSLPVTDTMQERPKGLYGATKLAAEHFCKIYNEVFDMNTAIARFSNVFGPFEQKDNNKKAAFNRMIYQLSTGGSIDLYDNGSVQRDYIYVSDVVSACDTIFKKGEKGEVYYVGRGELTSMRKMVDIILEEGKDGTVNNIEIPKFHTKSGINNFFCDVSKLKGLGWEPEISIRQGVKLTIESYR